MAFTLTTNKGTNAGGASFSIGTALTAGDLMVVGCSNTNASETITGATDTLGSTWHNFTFGSSGSTFAILWAALGGTGANSLTVTWSGAGTAGDVIFGEFTGTSVSGATQDGTGQGDHPASTVTNVVTPTITTTGADDLLLNYVWDNNGAGTFSSPWTAIGSTGAGFLGYDADVTAGTYAPNATVTSGGFCASVVVAIQAGGGGGGGSTLNVYTIN